MAEPARTGGQEGNDPVRLENPLPSFDLEASHDFFRKHGLGGRVSRGVQGSRRSAWSRKAKGVIWFLQQAVLLARPWLLRFPSEDETRVGNDWRHLWSEAHAFRSHVALLRAEYLVDGIETGASAW